MIIGLAGSFGAGKGVVVEYLVSQKKFTHYSASGFLTEEIVRRELPVNRDSMIEVANQLRGQHGPAYIIQTLYDRAIENGGDAIIESLRAVAEVEKIQELGGTVIGLDAQERLRFDRSVARGSNKDDVTYEKWREQEQRESNVTDPTKQNIFGALEKANYTIYNDGTLEELYAQVDAVLEQLTHR